MHSAPLTLGDVYKRWWPLAMSWLFMGLELPSVTAVVARLADPETNLAAIGGVVLPIAFLIEAPVIMLLSASTTLCRDQAAYWRLFRWVLSLIGILTVLHLVVCLTPLYSVVVEGWLGIPHQLAYEARIGLLLVTPFAGAVGYRRFQQGVLIRAGMAKTISLGTGIRLVAIFCPLILGLMAQSMNGVVIGTAAITAGVLAEALFIHLQVKRALPLLPAAGKGELTFSGFLHFYLPLAVTTLLFMAMQPIGSAALTRMANPTASLAAWPVTSGFLFLIRSVAVAYSEVVISLFDRPGAVQVLRLFTVLLASAVSLVLLLAITTHLGHLWFAQVSHLAPELVELSTTALWFALPAPLLSTLHSWYQGTLIHAKQSRAVTVSVAWNLITAVTSVVLLYFTTSITGLYGVFLSMTLGGIAQAWWLRRKARPLLLASSNSAPQP